MSLKLAKYKQATLLICIFLAHLLVFSSLFWNKNKNIEEKISESSELQIFLIPIAPSERTLSASSNTNKLQTPKPRLVSKSLQTKQSSSMSIQIVNPENSKVEKMDFDQLQSQLQKTQNKLTIDLSQIVKEIDIKPSRIDHYPKKKLETQIEKLRTGFTRAAPFEEYPDTTYENPDGSRMTKKNSNKGSICYRTQRATENVDFKNPRLREVKC